MEQQSYPAMTIEQLEHQLTFLSCPPERSDAAANEASEDRVDPLVSAIASSRPGESSNDSPPTTGLHGDVLSGAAASAWTRYTQSRLRQFGMR